MSTTLRSRRLRVLIVEDHEPDVHLILQGLREAEIAHEFIVCENSVEASRQLGRSRQHPPEPLPDLIILDLNLPIWSGLDLLAMLKEDYDFQTIPVVVFTSSIADEDLKRAYDLKAACYVRKPMRLDEYMQVVAWIRDFWMHTAELLPHS